MVTDFGQVECATWVPHTKYSTSNVITVSPCDSWSDHITCAVGRVLHSTDTLPGKYPNNTETVYSVLGANQVNTGRFEILHMDKECRIFLLEYTSGDPLPFKAVVGGKLSGIGGENTDLYVIRGRVNGLTVVGYYNPEVQRGYVEYRGIQELTHMDMLVLA